MVCRIERKLKRVNQQKRSIIIILVAIVTILISLWPDFHPERYFIKTYSLTVDCLLHGSFYFIINFILNKIFYNTFNSLLLSIAIAIISIIFELTQILIPGRSFTLMDIMSNSLGIFLSLSLFVISKKHKQS